MLKVISEHIDMAQMVFISFDYKNMVNLRELLPDGELQFLWHGEVTDELVKMLSKRKLDAVVNEAEGAIVISSDTIVYCNGEVFGKPRDMDDARRMLRAMSGHYHEVYSGIAVGDGKKTVVDAVSTKVYFRHITDSEIERYISESAVLDKAGAYGIQERASLFVEKIEGDYFNIVGLPVCRLGEILRDEFGYNL
jgi:septum formation protein